MRLFVGIAIAEEVREHVSAYVRELQSRLDKQEVRWMPPESWHITLKFIGEHQDPEAIKNQLSEIQASSFPISFRAAGFFTAKSPKVFWAGIDASTSLHALASRIDKDLIALGIAAETHEYSPHLTLARVGSGRQHGDRNSPRTPGMFTLQKLVQSSHAFSHPEFGTMTANEFFLFRSEPGPSGSKYTKLARFHLQ